MSPRKPLKRRSVALMALALGIVMAMGCHPTMNTADAPQSKRDINAVLHDHDRELMALRGVVGVYVGLLDDGRTECLKVMLAREDRNLERSIPKVIEGYRVVTEVTGEIKSLGPGNKAGQGEGPAAPR